MVFSQWWVYLRCCLGVGIVDFGSSGPGLYNGFSNVILFCFFAENTEFDFILAAVVSHSLVAC